MESSPFPMLWSPDDRSGSSGSKFPRPPIAVGRENSPKADDRFPVSMTASQNSNSNPRLSLPLLQGLLPFDRVRIGPDITKSLSASCRFRYGYKRSQTIPHGSSLGFNPPSPPQHKSSINMRLFESCYCFFCDYYD
jgi:hypothetical protein